MRAPLANPGRTTAPVCPSWNFRQAQEDFSASSISGGSDRDHDHQMINIADDEPLRQFASRHIELVSKDKDLSLRCSRRPAKAHQINPLRLLIGAIINPFTLCGQPFGSWQGSLMTKVGCRRVGLSTEKCKGPSLDALAWPGVGGRIGIVESGVCGKAGGPCGIRIEDLEDQRLMTLHLGEMVPHVQRVVGDVVNLSGAIGIAPLQHDKAFLRDATRIADR